MILHKFQQGIIEDDLTLSILYAERQTLEKSHLSQVESTWIKSEERKREKKRRR